MSRRDIWTDGSAVHDFIIYDNVFIMFIMGLNPALSLDDAER